MNSIDNPPVRVQACAGLTAKTNVFIRPILTLALLLLCLAPAHAQLFWTGQTNGVPVGDWDIGTTANWAGPSVYTDGSGVQFDDTATGTTNVNLTTTLQPASVTVDNTTLAYTFSGTGKISGSTGLTKSGTNTLTMATGANDYTGVTMLTAGTLVVSNLANGGLPSAIGASTADSANLMFQDGVLSYRGPAVTINRGYSVTTASTTAGPRLDLVGNLTFNGLIAAGGGQFDVFTKSGPGTLTYAGGNDNNLATGNYLVSEGTLVLDGTAGPQTNSMDTSNFSEMWVGHTTNTGASLVLSNTTLEIGNRLTIGRNNGTIGNVSSATLHNSLLTCLAVDLGQGAQVATQYLTLKGNSLLKLSSTSANMLIGRSAGANSTVYVKDTSSISNVNLSIVMGQTAFGALYVSGSGSVFTPVIPTPRDIDLGIAGGNALLSLSNNATATTGNLMVGFGQNNATAGGQGTLYVSDNAVVRARHFRVAYGINTTGTVYQTGGTIEPNLDTTLGVFRIGSGFDEGRSNNYANYYMSGGLLDCGRGSRAVTLDIGAHLGAYVYQSGGSILCSNVIFIGFQTNHLAGVTISNGVMSNLHPNNPIYVGWNGNGTLNVSGSGQVNIDGVVGLVLAANPASGTCKGVVNLNGGIISAKRVASVAGGDSTFNFNGGMLRAHEEANTASFMAGLATANVLAGGAVIDSGTNDILVAQPLLNGGGGGGLTKLGSGALRLLGTNTYTGTTLASSGILGGYGVIAGPVTIAAGATLDPGLAGAIGALRVNSSLALNGTSVMQISRNGGVLNGDSVSGLTSVNYGGTLIVTNIGPDALQPGDTFTLFSAAARSGTFSNVILPAGYSWNNNLAVDGTIAVSSGVPQTPTNITYSVSGNALTLSWPEAYTGWRLLVQTNNLGQGLSVNPLDWGEVAGSSGTNEVIITIDPAKPSQFYRMALP